MKKIFNRSVNKALYAIGYTSGFITMVVVPVAIFVMAVTI